METTIPSLFASTQKGDPAAAQQLFQQLYGELHRVAKRELARAVRDGFTDAEVAQAKESVLKQRQLARTQDASVAAALAQQLYLDRRFDFAAKIDGTVAALTAADVNAALRKYVNVDGFAYAYGGDFAKHH